MLTTFATKTIRQTDEAIATIESEIAQLQSQLTALQEQQQTIKSAEQQGLSAIHQYKQAIAAIAQLNEPEVLQAFLEEMATITNDAIGDRPHLPEAPVDEAPAEPEAADEMSFEEFEEKFKALYFEERKQQELRGVVAIYGTALCQKFMEENAISQQTINQYFNLLKSTGTIYSTKEKDNELIEWCE